MATTSKTIVKLYQFEPRREPSGSTESSSSEDSSSSEVSDTEDDLVDHLQKLNQSEVSPEKWCMCRHCKQMEINRECLCCHEIDQAKKKMDTGKILLIFQLLSVTYHECLI